MSVHTTWESNVRGYEVAMSDLSWTISKDKLKQMIVKAKVGLYERRERGLWELATKFREDPNQFKKQDNETIELIKEYYSCNNDKARVALSLLSKQQLDIIKMKLNKGGVK